MSKRLWALVALLIVAALGAAFWWLDFRAASSQTNTSSQVATASGGSKASTPGQALPELSVYVDGSDHLAGALSEELRTSLSASGKFGNVTILAEAPARGGGQVLLVDVVSGQAAWTPAYSQAQLTAKLAYASNGDATLDDRPSVVNIGPEGPVVNVTGELKVDDVTWGIISRPAYQRHLGRQIGTQVADALVKALGSVPS